jgi:hypothetical protein
MLVSGLRKECLVSGVLFPFLSAIIYWSAVLLRFSRKKCTMVSYYSSKLLTENLLVLKTAPTQNEPRYMQHTQDSG